MYLKSVSQINLFCVFQIVFKSIMPKPIYNIDINQNKYVIIIYLELTIWKQTKLLLKLMVQTLMKYKLHSII